MRSAAGTTRRCSRTVRSAIKTITVPRSGTFRPITGRRFPDARSIRGKARISGRSHSFHKARRGTTTFYVLHDVSRTVKADGRHGARIHRQAADGSSTQGLYDPANEPDIAYPYLFSYFRGEEWRAQRRGETACCATMLSPPRPDGIPGNDDTGTSVGVSRLLDDGLLSRTVRASRTTRLPVRFRSG
ncbi:MAG: glycoside hydrolase domain-containing protein [Alistipes sp.]